MELLGNREPNGAIFHAGNPGFQGRSQDGLALPFLRGEETEKP